ncbi:hypothetical protein BDQ17DRAFT_1181206, partial [Cyathus striatus]
QLAYKTIYSTTLLLPAWTACLEVLGKPIRLMPHDVHTRWNSTYDLLSFILSHK